MAQTKKYTPTDYNLCLYFKREGEKFIMFSVCIDGFLVISTDKSWTTKLYTDLKEKYNIKRLGFPDPCLGWSVTSDSDGSILLNQPHQVYLLLQDAGMQQCNPIKAPFPLDAKCHPPTEDDTACMEFQHEYQVRVGHIRYLADSTRPDLSYVASVLGAAFHRPTKRHKVLLSSVIRYMKGTRTLAYVTRQALLEIMA